LVYIFRQIGGAITAPVFRHCDYTRISGDYTGYLELHQAFEKGVSCIYLFNICLVGFLLTTFFVPELSLRKSNKTTSSVAAE
jgi:hypothetical protein